MNPRGGRREFAPDGWNVGSSSRVALAAGENFNNDILRALFCAGRDLDIVRRRTPD